MNTAPVHISPTEIPEANMNCMSRCIIDAMVADFARPEFQAGYKKWLKERSDSK